MKHVDYTNAIKNLSSLMDETTQSKLPITINRVGKDSVVMISYPLFKELMERAVRRRTEFKNVQRLDEI